MENLFDIISEVSGDTETKTVEKTSETTSQFSEEAIYIPLSYQIFSTNNNEATGKKDIIDTYYVDRSKGIVPNLKAQKKADLMKNAFPAKQFFVMAEYTVIDGGKTVTVSEMYYKTK